mgnify:CR=1 FL=1
MLNLIQHPVIPDSDSVLIQKLSFTVIPGLTRNLTKRGFLAFWKTSFLRNHLTPRASLPFAMCGHASGAGGTTAGSIVSSIVTVCCQLFCAASEPSDEAGDDSGEVVRF